MFTTDQQRWLFLTSVVITAAVITSDVVACCLWGHENTYSGVYRSLFQRHGSLWAAFLLWLGWLVGHLTPFP